MRHLTSRSAALAAVVIFLLGAGCSGDAFQKYKDSRYDKVNPPVKDNTAPVVQSVDVVSYNKIKVEFDEDIDQTTALTATNYHIQGVNRIDVVSAEHADDKSVTLTLSTGYVNGVIKGMQHGKDYTLLVQKVKDLNDNAMLADFASFVGRGQVYAVIKHGDSVMPDESPWPSFSGSDLVFTVGGDGVVSFMYSFDDGMWYSETKLSDSDKISLNSLSEGFHTLKVAGKNSEGVWQDVNQATVASFVVDTIAPAATLSHCPLELTSSGDINITVGGDGVTSYKYRLNDEPWSDATASSVAIKRTSLPDATYTIYVRGYDDAGNEQKSDTTYSWRVVTSGIIPSLSGLPDKATRATSVGVTVSGIGVNYYKYSVNGTWSSLRSSSEAINLSNLKEGTYTLEVTGYRTTDVTSVGETIEYVWTVDLTAPVCTISNVPSTVTNSQNAHIFVSSSAGDVATYKYRLDVGSRTGDVLGPYSVAVPIDLSSLPENTYTVTVIGYDAAGNEQSSSNLTTCSWTVDVTAPTVQLQNLPLVLTNVNTYSITAGGSGVVAYKFMFDDGSGSAKWSGEIAAGTIIDGFGLADGLYTVSVIGRDAAGNWQSMQLATEYSWTIDTVPPVAVIGNKPPTVTSLTDVNFSVGGTGLVKYQYRIDGGSWSAEINRLDNGAVTTIAKSGLSTGSHTVEVIGIDQTGNKQDASSATSYTWTIDPTIPTAVIGNTPCDDKGSTKQNSVNFTISACSAYKYMIDNSTWSNECNVSTNIVKSGLSEGEHVINVIGKNASGLWQDVSYCSTFTWTVDTTAPYAVITASSPLTAKFTGTEETVSYDSAAFTISGNDVYGFRYALLGPSDPAGYPDITKYTSEKLISSGSSESFSGLSNGEQRLYVIARDAAGNWQSAADPAVYCWIVNKTEPVASISSITSPTNITTINVTVSGTGVVAYKYSLDGASWSIEYDVSTAISRIGLAEGSHTLRVVGKNSLGVWQSVGSASSVSWIIDLDPPSKDDITFVMSNLPSNPTEKTYADIRVQGSTTGAISKIKYKLNSGSWSSEISVTEGSGPDYYATISLNSLVDNDYVLYVIACDSVGNWMDPANAKSYSWRVDSQRPVATITVPANFTSPTKTTSYSFIIGGAGIVQFQYQYSSDGGSTYTSWSSWTDVGSLPITASTEGNYILRVRGSRVSNPASESVVNVQTTANATSLSWTVDTTAPAVSILNPPSNGTATDISVSIGGTDVIAYQFCLDPSGSPASANDSTWWNANGTPSNSDRTVDYSITKSGIAEGTHVLLVRGRDLAGNWSQTSCSWTVSDVPLVAPAVTARGKYSSGLCYFDWVDPTGTNATMLEIASSSDFSANVTRFIVHGDNYYLPTDLDIDTYYARVWVSKNASASTDWNSTTNEPTDTSWKGPGASDSIKVVGDITGKVVDPTDSNNPVSGVTVKIYNEKANPYPGYVKDLVTGADIAVQTDANGVFTIPNIPIRTMTGNTPYRLELSKSGYSSSRKNNVTVYRGVVTDVGVLYMMNTAGKTAANVVARIVSANDCDASIQGASVSMSDGEGNTVTWSVSGVSYSSVTSDSAGYILIPSVAPGIYSVTVSKSNYYTVTRDNVAVNGADSSGVENLDLIPLCEYLYEPQVRIIYMCGEHPQDPDTFITGPTARILAAAPTNRFFVYSNQKSYNESDGTITSSGAPDFGDLTGAYSTTSLMKDDSTGGGPETVNLTRCKGVQYAKGTYTFSMHRSGYIDGKGSAQPRYSTYASWDNSNAVDTSTNFQDHLMRTTLTAGSNVVSVALSSYDSTSTESYLRYSYSKQYNLVQGSYIATRAETVVDDDLYKRHLFGMSGTGIPDGTYMMSYNRTTKEIVMSNKATQTGTVTVQFNNRMEHYGLYSGVPVTGDGIPANTTVTGVSGTFPNYTITLSNNATDSGLKNLIFTLGWGAQPSFFTVYDSGGAVRDINFSSSDLSRAENVWEAFKLDIQGNSRSKRRIIVVNKLAQLTPNSKTDFDW
jgi:hypothetical protein